MMVLGVIFIIIALLGLLVSLLMFAFGNGQKAKLAARNSLALLVIGFVLGVIGAGSTEGSSTTATPEKPITTNSAKAPANGSTSVEASKESKVKKPDLELLEAKAISDGYATYIVGKVRNNTSRKYSYVQVEINLYDGDGNLLGSTVDNVNNLEPGAVWRFKAPVFYDQAKKFKIMNITGF